LVDPRFPVSGRVCPGPESGEGGDTFETCPAKRRAWGNPELRIEGKKHELLVTRTGLVYQGEQIPLEDFKTVVVLGEKDMVCIVVNGKQVHPPSK
jgi:hypothetical protein